MRLTRHTFRTTRPGLNMGAMIDVVFLLLIFFMCTTSFKPREQSLAADLPQISSEAARREDFPPIYIQLSGDADQVAITCDAKPCETFDLLLAELKIRRDIDDIPVIIAGEPEVPFEYMVKARDKCETADLTRVAFSAQPEE
jgi:biopolymer transport protein ExbD